MFKKLIIITLAIMLAMTLSACGPKSHSAKHGKSMKCGAAKCQSGKCGADKCGAKKCSKDKCKSGKCGAGKCGK